MGMMIQSALFGAPEDPNLLDFTKGKLPSGVTYAGGVNGTCVASTGLLVAATGPRFDYAPDTLASLGILCEPARTNRITFSDSIDSFQSVGNMTITANNAVSPKGDNLADRLALNGAFGHARKFEVPFPDGTPGAFSVYLKSTTPSAGIYLTTNNTASWSTGLSSRFSPTAAWMRAAISGMLGTGYGRIHTMIGNVLADSGADATIPNETVNAWGAQLEVMLAGQRQEASSYIPTAGSEVTRTADAISFTIPAGITSLTYRFDDDSTQAVVVSAGPYVVPTNLNRARIKTIALA